MLILFGKATLVHYQCTVIWISNESIRIALQLGDQRLVFPERVGDKEVTKALMKSDKSTRRNSMEISCSSVCYVHIPVEDTLRRISSFGFRNLELLAIRGTCPH